MFWLRNNYVLWKSITGWNGNFFSNNNLLTRCKTQWAQPVVLPSRQDSQWATWPPWRLLMRNLVSPECDMINRRNEKESKSREKYSSVALRWSSWFKWPSSTLWSNAPTRAGDRFVRSNRNGPVFKAKHDSTAEKEWIGYPKLILHAVYKTTMGFKSNMA